KNHPRRWLTPSERRSLFRQKGKPALCETGVAQRGSLGGSRCGERFRVEIRLALAELEALAGAGLAGLFALFHARVARQQTLGLQHPAKFRARHEKRTGDAEADRPGLAADSAAARVRGDVIDIAALGDFEGLEHEALK